MFKATENKRKIRETNLLINMEIKNFLPAEVQTIISRSFQVLSWDSLGIKNVSPTNAQTFQKVNKSWQRKRCSRNYIMKILLKEFKIALWISFRRNQWNTMTACMQHPYRNEESGNPTGQYPQSAK